MPNYLITGDDEFIKEKELSGIKDKYLSEDETSLNYSVHSVEDNIDNITNSVETLPFIAEYRVVVIKDLQRFQDRQAEVVLELAGRKVKTTVLILCADAGFRKKKIFREFSSCCESVTADKPELSDVRGWIKSFFKREKINITDDAVRLLLDFKGNDTQGIKMELEKLAAYSNGAGINASDVESVIIKGVKENVFKLVDAINTKNPEWAFNVLDDLYSERKSPHEILGYLSWYLRIMQRIKSLTIRGLGIDEVSRALGYSRGYVKRLSGQAARYAEEKIRKWGCYFLEADNDIKTGRYKAELVIEMLLVKLLK